MIKSRSFRLWKVYKMRFARNRDLQQPQHTHAEDVGAAWVWPTSAFLCLFCYLHCHLFFSSSLSGRCVSVFSLPGSRRPCNEQFISPALHPFPSHILHHTVHTQATTRFLKNLLYPRPVWDFSPYVLSLEEGGRGISLCFPSLQRWMDSFCRAGRGSP